MKLRQNARHFATRKALELPVVGPRVHDWLVDLHTETFLERAAEGRREERREHLEALFDAAVDVYLVALQSGYTEAEAREMTHILANFDFHRHGWTEMMEFPSDEVREHFSRYGDFFIEHGIGTADPLGEFAPAGGLPDAPETPDAREQFGHPNATGGFADDVYVEGGADPADADVEDVPVVDESPEER